MPVFSFVSSKGGSGKTTSSVIMAGEVAAAGADVIIIDADPNRPLERWAKLSGKPDNIQVIVDESAETIVDTITEAREKAKVVIVDLEGTATDRIGFAISQSDLVLVPIQGSVLDANEAAKSIKLIRQMSKVINREVAYRLFFSKIPAVIQEKTYKNIHAQFESADIPMLNSALIDRAAFRSLFSLGGTIRTLDQGDVSGLGKARDNAAAFTQEIMNIYNEARKAA